MKNRHLDSDFKPFSLVAAHRDTKSEISQGDSFFLILEGFRVGPFLCLGPIDHLEMILHSRGIEIAA